MNKFFRTTTLTALLLAALPAAHATVQAYNFSGTLDSGVFNGETFSGNFSFDDALIPFVDINGASWFAVTGMTLNFHNNTYTQANGDAAPDVAFFNGSLLGLSYSSSIGDPQLALIAAMPNDPYPAYLSYDTSAGLSGAGTINYAAAVPEPESYAMLLAGLGLMGVLARRKALRG